MIKRELQSTIIDMAKKMPIISITGPRQSGKTTLAKVCFPDYDYYNLENPSILERAKMDPQSFLTRHSKGIIIDEVQLFPELFSYIQVISDENKKDGEFILTGSQNFLLLQKIAQSLAGRVYITHLLPLSISELKNTNYWHEDSNHYLFNGFYPRIYEKDINPTFYFPSYIQTYVERDVRQIVNISNTSIFQKFMKIVAGRVGQLINFNNISNELGVDQKTVKSWFSILEASFIVFFLQPHHKNFNKRIVKTPKLYFYDTGLASNLLGIQDEDSLDLHWAKGALFENLIILEMLKTNLNKGLQPKLYFWRDNTGNEIDCIEERGEDIYSYEIKSSKTIQKDFFKGLNYYNKISDSKNKTSYLVYGGNDSYPLSEHSVLSWKDLKV